jgi:hypothetical protein
MSTVIDSLIVTLGLDPKQFTKGQKDAAKAMTDTEKTVKHSAQEMTKALKEVALEFVGLFLVVRGIHDVVSFFEELNSKTRQLGIDARNIGTSAAELRDWQNAAEMAGGSAEGVTKTMLGMQQALFNMKFKGEVSDQLIYLARLGVQFQTAAGQARPFKDVMFDTAKAMEASRMSDPDKSSFLQAAGFDAGSINLILGGTKALDEAYRKQKAMEQVNRANTEAARKLDQAWIGLKQGLVAVATQVLTALTPSLQSLFGLLDKDVIQDWGDKIVAWAKGDGPNQIKTAFNAIEDSLKTLIGTINALASAWKYTLGPLVESIGGAYDIMHDAGQRVSPEERANFARLKYADYLSKHRDINIGSGAPGLRGGETRAQRNHNPGNLKATGNQARDKDGFAVFGSDAEGIEAARHQLSLYSGRGLNTIGQIISTWAPAADGNNTAAYIASVSKNTGIAANAQLTPEQLAAVARAMFNQESTGNAQTSFIAPIPGALNAARGAQATLSLAAAPPGANAPPTASNTTSSIQFGSITINSQATDANGIARDLHREISRRFTVAQSDSAQLA